MRGRLVPQPLRRVASPLLPAFAIGLASYFVFLKTYLGYRPSSGIAAAVLVLATAVFVGWDRKVAPAPE